MARDEALDVRRDLAARSDVEPEILYFLAEDPAPEVRRQIAVNTVTPVHADLLLASDDDEHVRGNLAGKIAALAPGLSADEQDKVRQMTYQVLEALARDQATRVRQILSDALKDIADALGVTRVPSARLRHVAHIGVGARAFSYMANGLEVPEEPVRVELTAPGGTLWTWGPDGVPNRVTGTAHDFCLLGTQRRHRDDTALHVTGPLADQWLSIAQAFAGPPGGGRARNADSQSQFALWHAPPPRFAGAPRRDDRWCSHHRRGLRGLCRGRGRSPGKRLRQRRRLPHAVNMTAISNGNVAGSGTAVIQRGSLATRIWLAGVPAPPDNVRPPSSPTTRTRPVKIAVKSTFTAVVPLLQRSTASFPSRSS